MEGMAYLAALAVLALAVYVGSLYLHPNANCFRCKGSGKHRGLLFSYAHRPCTTCGGKGRLPRWGRRLFGPRVER